MTAFGDWAEYTQRMASLIEGIRHSPRAPGVDRIYLPGEIEWLKEREYRQSGIPVPAGVLGELRELAAEFGAVVDLPSA